jgi:hypothetical protein
MLFMDLAGVFIAQDAIKNIAKQEDQIPFFLIGK